MTTTSKPKGLAKIWREIKRPFCNFFPKQSDMPQERYYIRPDGRVEFPYFEIDIVLGCNLRCSHCSHLSPYRKVFVPTEKLVHWFETWSKKIHPRKIHLLGGEPFLHTDLATVLLESRRIWKDATLEIVSNGLIISHASQDVFNAIKNAQIRVVVSDHSSVDLPYEKLVAGCARLKDNDIPYEIASSNNVWRVQHQWSEEGLPAPFQSRSCDAWSVCVPKQCPALANNRLYRCSVLASIIEGVNEGSLSPTLWKDALTYAPLPPEADADTILKHFCSEDEKACSVCPDKIMFTEASQLPPLSQSHRKAS
jgi:hypothetical protein